MSIQPPSADDIAAGLEKFCHAAAGKQRSGKKNTGAVAGAEFTGDDVGFHIFAAETQGVFFKGVFRSERNGNIQHGVHIQNIRHIAQYRLFIGQHQCRNHGQNRIFVTGNSHLTAPDRTPFDNQ